MMTKKCSFRKLFIFILLISLPLQPFYSEEMNKWTVAVEKFVFNKGQSNNSVTKGIGETIPKSILENLNRYFVRNIRPGEDFERKCNDLRKKRQALYLQLSSEYQKRDALFLSYSDKKLQKKIKEQNKKIAEIEQQINDNLEEVKSAETELKELLEKELNKSDFNEDDKSKKKNSMSSFFKNIISNEKAVIKSEEIKLFGDKTDVLYVPSEEAAKQGYTSPIFREEMIEKGINSYIAGNISIFGNYISVTADVYLYPGARKAGSVTEVGSVNDLEFLASSLVTEIVPLLTNSMPVNLNFFINPDIGFNNVKLYIDDILQKTDGKNLIIDSGVHSFQVAADGYKSLSTSYFFEGDTNYNIELNLEEKKEGSVFVNFKNPVQGKLYTNGVLAETLNESQAKISINGVKVLGEFISEEGETAFFYVPEKLFRDGNYVQINPKAIDRSEYIDKRRRWMYGSYSAFMISLIPYFITTGAFENEKMLYYSGHSDYKSALKWQNAANVCAGISIGLGIFWGVELIRYLISANSVLPEKAKQSQPLEYFDIDYGIEDNKEPENTE